MFQSAPLTEARGDLKATRNHELTRTSFQSAPLTEARGDLSNGISPPDRHMFQSAPLTEARGDLDDNLLSSPVGEVSIRSPYRSKGRPQNSLEASEPQQVSIRSPYRSKGRPLVAVTSKVSEGYIGCSAIRSNEYRYILMRLSKYGVTSSYADYCERRESAGNTPALWVRASLQN